MTSHRRTLRRHKLAMIEALEQGMHRARATNEGAGGDDAARPRDRGDRARGAAGPSPARARTGRAAGPAPASLAATVRRAAGRGLADGAAWIATAALGVADVAVDEAGDVVCRPVWGSSSSSSSSSSPGTGTAASSPVAAAHWPEDPRAVDSRAAGGRLTLLRADR